MARSRSALALLCGVVALLVGPSPAALAGGFELADQGPRAAGRAGAFIVRADDVSAMDYNPAGLARVRGTQVFLANRFTFSSEEFRRARTLDWSDATHGVPQLVSFEPVHNGVTQQLLGPMIGVSTDFGLDRWGFAAGVYGPPGTTKQEFPLDGAQRYMLVEREVMILYYTLSVAWQPHDQFAVGLSLQWVDVPTLDFDLVIDGNTSPRLVKPVESRFDFENRISGSDRIGFTAILGLWYQPAPGWEIAVSGRVIPVPIETTSHISLTALGLDLDTPPTITRDGQPDNEVSFSFTLPAKFRAGVRYAHVRNDREVFDIELNLGWETWSTVDAFVLNGEGLQTEVLGQVVPIGTIRIERQWKDTWSLRLGGDWNVVPGWFTLRAGAFWESGATPESNAYIDVYDSHRLGASVGFSFTWEGLDVSASYTYVFLMPVVVEEEESRIFQQTPGSACKPPYTDRNTCSEYYLGQPSAVANAGTYLADYHFLSVGLSYRF